VAKNADVDIEHCRITEAHYFRGRAIKSDNEKAIIGERYFEDALTRAGVQQHYLPLIRGGVNNELKEKGIDVSLAIDAYKKAAGKAMDIFVLVAGDGDYLPLVRELQAMKTPGIPIDVMLVSWDFKCANGDLTITSQDLLEEVKYPIQMATVIDDRVRRKDPFINGLFEPRQVETDSLQEPKWASAETQETPQNIQPTAGTTRRELSEEELAQEWESTILSLNGKGGWILNREYNNFYFFFGDVVNKSPEKLAVGDRIRFYLKPDAIKASKENNEPSYRATGPIYAV
jgi:uncharacterized LabA/DUF88 family protein